MLYETNMKFTPLTGARRSWQAAIIGVAAAMLALAGAAPDKPNDKTILVFAASSLAPPLERIAALYQARSSVKLRFAFASSAALARQIEYGAPADIFITAHPLWLERLADQQMIDMAAVRAIAGNRLVLVRAGQASRETDDLRALLLKPGMGRIATGDPASVPLGIYVRDNLQGMGLWEVISPRLAPAANARAALLQVERGLAPLGILFASDAASSGDVTIVAEFLPGSDGPIQYLAAMIAGPTTSEATGEAAADFLIYLTGPEATEIFLQTGFSAPE